MGDEGDKREATDELFEDLDKFFAPIKDVEWPEPEEPTTEEKPPQVEAPPSVPPPTEPVVVERMAPEAPPEPAPGEREPEPTVPDEEEPSFPEPEEIEVEEEPSFPEPEEIEVEEAPSEEAVEAAVEHFADSVREEAAEPAIETAEMPAMDVFAEEHPPAPGEAGDVEEGALEDVEAAVPRTTIKVGAEGVSGPSWQEPGALEVGADLERRPGERDVPAAFITGLVLAVLAVGSLLISPAAFAVVASILVLLGQGELYMVLHRRHRQPATGVGLVAGALILAAAYLRGEAAMLSMVALGTVAVFFWYMAVPSVHRKDVIGNVALTLLPVVYGPLLAGYALTTLAIERASDGSPLDGKALILAVVGLTFAYDTAAFAGGWWFGAHQLAPSVSPKKSWEGVVVATLVVIFGSVAFVTETIGSVWSAVGLAGVVAVFAPLGDLAESLLKRDLGVKDMGSILPGHGGVMDRIDSVLFVAPAALIYFRLVL